MNNADFLKTPEQVVQQSSYYNRYGEPNKIVGYKKLVKSSENKATVYAIAIMAFAFLIGLLSEFI